MQIDSGLNAFLPSNMRFWMKYFCLWLHHLHMTESLLSELLTEWLYCIAGPFVPSFSAESLPHALRICPEHWACTHCGFPGWRSLLLLRSPPTRASLYFMTPIREFAIRNCGLICHLQWFLPNIRNELIPSLWLYRRNDVSFDGVGGASPVLAANSAIDTDRPIWPKKMLLKC